MSSSHNDGVAGSVCFGRLGADVTKDAEHGSFAFWVMLHGNDVFNEKQAVAESFIDCRISRDFESSCVASGH